MRLFRSSALAAVLAMTSAAMAAPPAQAQISIGISVNFAPPPLPVYEQPPIPDADFIWIPGYWAWDDDIYDYYWVPGTWAPAPEPGLLWTPAWWGWNNGGYGFHDGYWAPHVGYYGGIAYGFGYNGSDYEGGEWRGGRFFYNRSVNNVTNVNITNVYNKTVIVNQSTTASFNGPGGASAQPTSQQLAVAQERHVAPTAMQTQHVRAALAMPALRASANHGAPPVAATARPAAFTGEGVVKAARPGGDYHAPPAAVARQAQARAAHGETPTAPAAHAAETRAPANPASQTHDDQAAPRAPPRTEQDRAQPRPGAESPERTERAPSASPDDQPTTHSDRPASATPERQEVQRAAPEPAMHAGPPRPASTPHSAPPPRRAAPSPPKHAPAPKTEDKKSDR
jgi:hypothetical protein